MLRSIVPALLLCSLIALPLSGADEKPAAPAALTSSKINNNWTLEGRRKDELVFVKGPGHEPVLEFNSHAFRGREVGVDIETDTNQILISNAGGEVNLRLEPNKKYRFKLDGDADKPRIMLGNKELVLQSPDWGRVINAEGIHSFRVLLLDATEVRIKFKVRGGELPIRSPQDQEDQKK